MNPAPLWMLNEDVVPFSEQMIINKENASAHRLAEEWIQNRRSAIRQKGIHSKSKVIQGKIT